MKGSCTARSVAGQPHLVYSEKIKVKHAPEHYKSLLICLINNRKKMRKSRNNEVVSKFRNWIARVPTSTLITIPNLIALIFVGIGACVNPKNFAGKPYDLYIAFGFLFFGGLSGIPMIVRKEAPNFIFPLEGFLAVLQGIAFLIIGWGLAFGFLYFYLARTGSLW